ncbi:MAG: hypothetical protein AAGA57_03755 [Planctomycetota bacterium]
MSGKTRPPGGSDGLSYFGFGPQSPPYLKRWNPPRRAAGLRSRRKGRGVIARVATVVRGVRGFNYRRYAPAVLGLGGLVAVVVAAAALDLADEVSPGARAPDEQWAFRIGPASEFRAPGVYHDFVKSHGVFLVSDHGMLVALDAKSPEAPNRTLMYDRDDQQFRCPRTGAVYSRDGLPFSGSTATRAMERCFIRGLGPDDDPETVVMVNTGPERRYRFEDNQWSHPFSGRLFADQL